MKRIVIFIYFHPFLTNLKCARILAVFPTPSISHHFVYRPLIHELVNRGHQVVLITPDPTYPKGNGPANLTEIDVHDLAYRSWSEYKPKDRSFGNAGEEINLADQTAFILLVFSKILEEEAMSDQVQKLMKNKSQKFDLIIIELWIRATIVFSHLYKNAPVIQLNSFGPLPYNIQITGGATHPILYPFYYVRQVNNLTSWQRLLAIKNYMQYEIILKTLESLEHDSMKRIGGANVSTVEELANNVDMLSVNIDPMRDYNRPVPLNVIYMGGMHLTSAKELPMVPY